MIPSTGKPFGYIQQKNRFKGTLEKWGQMHSSQNYINSSLLPMFRLISSPLIGVFLKKQISSVPITLHPNKKGSF